MRWGEEVEGPGAVLGGGLRVTLELWKDLALSKSSQCVVHFYLYEVPKQANVSDGNGSQHDGDFWEVAVDWGRL